MIGYPTGKEHLPQLFTAPVNQAYWGLGFKGVVLW